MKLTNRDILVVQGTVAGLMQRSFTLDKLPGKLFYRLNKLNRKLQREAEDFERDRLALVEKYSEAAEEGKPRRVAKDKEKQFMGDIEEILDEELDVDIQPVPKELFLLLPDLELRAEEWVNLALIVEDDLIEK